MRKRWLVAGAVVLLLTACGKSNHTADEKETLNRMESAPLTMMDPARTVDAVSGQAQTDTILGLYNFKGSKLVPTLATKIVTPTNNGKTYTFNLRHAKWSNGQSITAKDFVYGWKRAIDPKTKSEYAYQFSGVLNADAIMAGKKQPNTLGIKALGKYKLQVQLEKPIPYFTKLLVSAIFSPVSEKAVAKYGKKFGTAAKYTLASGPFKLKDWDGTSDHWTEVKNPYYYDAKHVKLQKINVQVVKDSTTAMNLYKTKKLDEVVLTGEKAAQAKTMSDYQGLRQATVFYLSLNTSKVKALQNTKIRQALSMMLDRKAFIKNVLRDGSAPAKGLVPAGMVTNPKTGADFVSDATKGQTTVNSYAPAKAKSLWTQGLKAAGQSNLTLTLLTDDTEEGKEMAEYVQGAFSKLPNLKVELRTMPAKTRNAALQSGDYQVGVTAWGADFPDAVNFLSLLQTGNTYNFGKWSNQDFDRLINASNNDYATDEQGRYVALVKAQRLLTKEAPVIPIYQRVQTSLLRKSVSGMIYNANNTFNFTTTSVK